MSSLALFYNIDTYEAFKLKKLSCDSENNMYVTGGWDTNAKPLVGTPDVPWEGIVFIKDIGQIYFLGKMYGGGSSDDYVKTSGDSIIDGTLGFINSSDYIANANITCDRICLQVYNSSNKNNNASLRYYTQITALDFRCCASNYGVVSISPTKIGFNSGTSLTPNSCNLANIMMVEDGNVSIDGSCNAISHLTYNINIIDEATENYTKIVSSEFIQDGSTSNTLITPGTIHLSQGTNVARITANEFSVISGTNGTCITADEFSVMSGTNVARITADEFSFIKGKFDGNTTSVKTTLPLYSPNFITYDKKNNYPVHLYYNLYSHIGGNIRFDNNTQGLQIFTGVIYQESEILVDGTISNSGYNAYVKIYIKLIPLDTTYGIDVQVYSSNYSHPFTHLYIRRKNGISLILAPSNISSYNYDMYLYGKIAEYNNTSPVLASQIAEITSDDIPVEISKTGKYYYIHTAGILEHTQISSYA